MIRRRYIRTRQLQPGMKMDQSVVDRSKVLLSKSVRDRISHGIQSIYSNTDTQNIASTTASITNDLMTAIDSNNAIAIDIKTRVSYGCEGKADFSLCQNSFSGGYI